MFLQCCQFYKLLYLHIQYSSCLKQFSLEQTFIFFVFCPEDALLYTSQLLWNLESYIDGSKPDMHCKQLALDASIKV